MVMMMNFNQLGLGVGTLLLALTGCNYTPYGNRMQGEEIARTAERYEGNTMRLSSPQCKTAREAYIKEFGEPQVTFQEDDQGLRVSIITKRLQITSVSQADLADYYQYLYSSKDVMEKFATGETKEQAYAEKRMTSWVNRWRDKQPFAGLTIRLLDTSDTHVQGSFLGHIVLGGGDEANSSAMAYMLREDKWNRRYGSEAIGAAVLFYALEMSKRGYKLPNGETFGHIIATPRIDNEPSCRILEHLGFSNYHQSEKFGHQRTHYKLHVTDLQKASN